VVARPCKASWEITFSGIVCVAPLRVKGLKGKKSTPSVGWEVSVRSQRLASRSSMERRHGIATLGSSPSDSVRMCKFALYFSQILCI
jgi:hypothetical protein